jgi:class 3 adenylate cyclase/tetratricopeptide (TPR) repeat protein
VLFADVVGFTSLAERTDPEVVARMVDSAFRQLGQVVMAHGGTVDKYMGDSLMAVFGVPSAHDDDAERAVAAALAMRNLGGDLAFSIGVNSGEIMATPLGDDGGDVTVIGDTVNVAARLEKAAGPGEVLCGSLTVELVGERAVFVPRQPVILKGKREPVEVSEAVALRRAGDDAVSEKLPLVGRLDELSYLAALWQRVTGDRQFQMVLLCGDAGSGKTRLATELGRVAEVDGLVVTASYPAYGTLGGVAIVSDVVSQIGPSDDPEVVTRVASLAGRSDETMRSMDPDTLQKEQLWGFMRLLDEKASERPLLIVVDDTHRSSEIMLKFVARLVTRIHELPLLLVLAGRSNPSGWLAHFPTATTVRLSALNRADAATLACAFAADKPLTADASDFLVDRAGGNPLYLRELVRMAKDAGSLVEEDGHYGLRMAAALPASLHALLTARLDTLGPGQKQVFQHVALLGADATTDTIEELGGPGVAGPLSLLVDGGLLHREGSAFEVVDPLLSEVAYDMLTRHGRGELHRRAADLALRPEERARHLERAAEYMPESPALAEAAADELVHLGEAYIDAARYPEAVRLLERAVVLGSRRPAPLLKLAELQGLGGDVDVAMATLSLIPDDSEDPSIALEREHAMARALMITDPEGALPGLEAVEGRWRDLGRKANEAWAIANAGVANFYLNRMERAAAELERALCAFEAVGDRSGTVASSSFLSLVKPADKRVPEWLAAALAFADETGERSKQMSALSPLAWNRFLLTMWGDPGETAEAEGFAGRLAEVADRLGAEEMMVHARCLLAMMARWSGRMDVAADHQAALGRIVERPGRAEAWLGWAVGFSVAVARGASNATAPIPPPDIADPVVGIAALVVRAELAFSGRVDEAAAQIDTVSRRHGAVADASGIVDALVLLLCGRAEEARLRAERAVTAADALGARPTGMLARALLSEVTGDPVWLDPMPDSARSVADAVSIRAHAAFGDGEAVDKLRDASRRLALPGLMLRLPGTSSEEIFAGTPPVHRQPAAD